MGTALLILAVLGIVLTWTFIWLVLIVFLADLCPYLPTPIAYTALFLGGPIIWVLYLALHWVSRCEEGND